MLSCFYGCFFLVYLNVNLLFCKFCLLHYDTKKMFQKAVVLVSWIHFWITEVFYGLVRDWENQIRLKMKTILSFSQSNVQFLIWSSSGVILELLMGLEEWPWITSVKEAYRLWMLKQLLDTLYISVICCKLCGKMGHQKNGRPTTGKMHWSSSIHICGADMFGCLTINERRSELKCYGALFTCLSCWAVHIQVTNSLDADSFNLALCG